MRGVHRFALVILFSVCASAQIPVIKTGGIVNAASFDPNEPTTPGSLISIFGDNLASATAQADTIPLGTQLANVSVSFITATGTIAAPMQFAGLSQLNLQVPWDVVPPGGSGTVNVVVTRNGQSSSPMQMMVGPFSPAVFASGGRAIAVNNIDGTLAWPAGAVQWFATHPAKPGDVLIVYANGLGAVDVPLPNGAAAGATLRSTLSNPLVLVGGMSAKVLFSGLAPQFVGVNQLNIVVPADAPAGDAVALQLQMGGITTSDQVTIAITR